ncbi:MAG: DNA-processing protein DprA, partial [Candidatus Zixiibacteriota bacterium]
MLALCHLSGVTPRLFTLLMSRFGSLEEIMTADEGTLRAIKELPERQRQAIMQARQRLEQAAAFEQQLAAQEIKVVTRLDENYPPLLFELNDPPPLLYYRGQLPDAKKRTVALVGAVAAGAEGMEMTSRLAREFVKNDVQVIASLHVGIDAAALLAVRAAEGYALAVADRGFAHIETAEMTALANDIIASGGLLSEYAPDRPHTDALTGESNRLVVGLAQAVVVTEVYGDATRTLDLLKFCQQIGKLTFVMIDPELGAFADEAGLSKAIEYGAIPIKGYE